MLLYAWVNQWDSRHRPRPKGRVAEYYMKEQSTITVKVIRRKYYHHEMFLGD